MRALISIFTALLPVMAWAQGNPYVTPGAGTGKDSMMANSPFHVYTAGAVAYTIVAMFLVMVLLVGGFLVVNLGMMSKREEDSVGDREPGDVGILKGERFPDARFVRRVLPPEEDDDQPELPEHIHPFPRKYLLHEEDMAPDVSPPRRKRAFSRKSRTKGRKSA